MRSAEQIRRTPRGWLDAQAAERGRIRAQLLAELRRAREDGAEWYRWIAEGMPPLSRAQYDQTKAAAGTRGARNAADVRDTPPKARRDQEAVPESATSGAASTLWTEAS